MSSVSNKDLRFDALFNSATIGIIVVNGKGIIDITIRRAVRRQNNGNNWLDSQLFMTNVIF